LSGDWYGAAMDIYGRVGVALLASAPNTHRAILVLLFQITNSILLSTLRYHGTGFASYSRTYIESRIHLSPCFDMLFSPLTTFYARYMEVQLPNAKLHQRAMLFRRIVLDANISDLPWTTVSRDLTRSQ
jgi:hypothetical protein